MQATFSTHRWVLLLIAVSSTPAPVLADEIRAAVASNFVPVLEQLATRFTEQSGHTIAISGGASGGLYTQISNGAPFDVYFSADSERPARLIAENRAVADSVFTYAVGQLVLWSSTKDIGENGKAILEAGKFAHLAIANPKLAPYGLAAQQTLERLQLADSMVGKLVLGENIAQTLQFTASGNAELGFIGLAQWQALPAEQRLTPWHVPAELHAPITQDAVILHDTKAARTFMDYIRSDAARTLIQQAGYTLP